MGSQDRELKGLALLEGLGYVGEYQICADLRCELRIIPRRIERFGHDGIYDDLRQEQWMDPSSFAPSLLRGPSFFYYPFDEAKRFRGLSLCPSRAC